MNHYDYSAWAEVQQHSSFYVLFPTFIFKNINNRSDQVSKSFVHRFLKLQCNWTSGLSNSQSSQRLSLPAEHLGDEVVPEERDDRHGFPQDGLSLPFCQRHALWRLVWVHVQHAEWREHKVILVGLLTNMDSLASVQLSKSQQQKHCQHTFFLSFTFCFLIVTHVYLETWCTSKRTNHWDVVGQP